MIQFLPLEMHPNNRAILELYFYMVAIATPFLPEDVFPTDYFHEQGDILNPVFPVKSFYKISRKKPRKRTKNYRNLLHDYGVNNGSDVSTKDRLENDARLAKAIIEKIFEGTSADKSLYVFLYEGMPQDDFHVNKEHLHCLLTSYMDDGTLKHSKLNFENLNHKNLLNDLLEVFYYDKFAKMASSVQLMELLDVPVCPYCNRNFTTTVSRSKGIRQGQFDHYRNKSQNPWFALSLLNLIPACGFCNQSKGGSIKSVLYPYKEGMDKYYRFRTKPVHGFGYLTGAPQTLDEFEVVGEFGPVLPTREQAEHIQNSLDLFHLRELYQTHQEHIVWIFRQRYIFPDAYLDQLCETFKTLNFSLQDARDMLYMRHISPEHWGEYPLSKLTHDIDEEITELENHSYAGIK